MAIANPFRSSHYIAILLLCLALTAGLHLWMLRAGATECNAYRTVLLSRLSKAVSGCDEAESLREEIGNHLDATVSECALEIQAYSQSLEKYGGIMLSLLTGAGVAVGIGAVNRDKL